jgi:hypothetical protein
MALAVRKISLTQVQCRAGYAPRQRTMPMQIIGFPEASFDGSRVTDDGR